MYECTSRPNSNDLYTAQSSITCTALTQAEQPAPRSWLNAWIWLNLKIFWFIKKYFSSCLTMPSLVKKKKKTNFLKPPVMWSEILNKLPNTKTKSKLWWWFPWKTYFAHQSHGINMMSLVSACGTSFKRSVWEVTSSSLLCSSFVLKWHMFPWDSHWGWRKKDAHTFPQEINGCVGLYHSGGTFPSLSQNFLPVLAVKNSSGHVGLGYFYQENRD